MSPLSKASIDICQSSIKHQNAVSVLNASQCTAAITMATAVHLVFSCHWKSQWKLGHILIYLDGFNDFNPLVHHWDSGGSLHGPTTRLRNLKSWMCREMMRSMVEDQEADGKY